MIVASILAAFLATTPVPDGRYMLLNGSLGVGEWADSCTVRLDSNTEIRFHKDDESLFVAVVFLGPRHTGADLYLQSGGGTRIMPLALEGCQPLRAPRFARVAPGRPAGYACVLPFSIVGVPQTVYAESG